MRIHWVVPIVAVPLVMGLACSREQTPSLARARSDVRGTDRLAGLSEAGPSSLQRKIVRDLTVRMRVDDVTAFLRSVEALAASSGGYVADREVEQDTDRSRSGSVTVRVASDRVESIGEALRALGTVEVETLKSDDISEQYYDLTARLHNAQQLEGRLIALLSERTGKLSDVVEVETKLAAVRETIEQLQGKQRRWDDQVSLATLRITFHSEPRSAVFAGGFGQEWIAVLGKSAQAFVGFARSVALLGAALLPWLPIPVAFWLLLRLRRSRTLQ